MSEKHKQNGPQIPEEPVTPPEDEAVSAPAEEPVPQPEETPEPQPDELELAKARLAAAESELAALRAGCEAVKADLAAKEDAYRRLAAEYDNYRRRTQKEKDGIWADAKADTAAAFLPVYDNLERALKQTTADEAFKKGVEMTMQQLREVLARLGIEEIPALGQPFDPTLHNAVMHVEDDSAGENTVVEVFQAGFRSGGKVIRFAMVKVAN